MALDFMDVSLVFLIVVLVGYAVYAVRAVLSERQTEETLFYETKNLHFIPFSLRQLQTGATGAHTTKDGPSPAAWKEFLLKVNLVFTARFQLLKAALLEDYEPFDPNLDVPIELPESKVNLLEDRFASNFHHMMERANYTMLTDSDAEAAAVSNFLNTVPIEPQWLKMDPLFARYMEAHPDLAETAYEGANRLWIYHRGVGIETFTGTLFLQKLDSLLFLLFGRCCGKRKKVARVGHAANSPNPTSPAAAATTATAAAPVKDTVAQIAANLAASNKANIDVMSYTKKQGVERISIDSIVKKNGWSSLLKSQTIQEPTYKEVVLAYRINTQRDPLFGSHNSNAIYIKIFRDIPHADLEVCYPCKTTTLRPLDVVKFAGAGIFGLVSILMQRQAGELVGYSALTGFATLAVSVLFDYQYHQSVYEQTTLRDLYSKSKDADQGAITYLMEQVCLQEVKEVFLGYFFLALSKVPLSQDELDERVEQFLAEMQTVHGHRESKIDFEADDALEKLVNMQLVTVAEGKYLAIPLPEAVDELTAQWTGMFQAKDLK